MAFVYLISEGEDSNKFKIGSTRAKDVNHRLKQLQTGNSNDLFVKEAFETDSPFRLEKMLHYRFKNNNVNGEWFELNKHDVDDFRGVCEQYQTIINAMKDNPFSKTI